MASRENTSDAKENALNAAQVEFTANPLFLAPQTKYFLQAQERIFDEVEKFSAVWFRRRQEATQSMIDMGRRIVSQGRVDPASAMKEIADWQTHSMQRLAEDAKGCSEMMAKCAGALASNEVKAIEETTETLRKATSSSKSEAV
ncbi:MAG: hypothetical protein WBP18_14600 [Paracoccaceae bacterium]|jgi:hypothetical protein